MQRILFGVLFLIVVGSSINISALSSNINYNNLYQTSGGQPASSTSSGTPSSLVNYVIVDGPGVGTQIDTVTDPTTGMVTASPKDNQVPGAEGHIGGIGVGEGMNCPGPLGHYHGTLMGVADPDPKNCGWGHVAEFTSLSQGLKNISNFILDETIIINKVNQDPPDYEGASEYADENIMDLSKVQDDIRNPEKTMIGSGKAKAVSDKLGKALKDDKFVLMTLTPLPTKRDPDKDAAINFKINNALMVKQEAFMILTEAEAMAAAMAGAMGE